MSWRKFSVLLRGLSFNSLWYNICTNKKSENLIEDPEESEKLVNRIW